MERRTRAVCYFPPSCTDGFAHRARCWSGPTVAADPNVSIRINCDSMHRVRPIIAFARPSPVTYQVARLIEFQYRRCRGATIGSRRILRRVGFHSFQGSGTVNNPDMVQCINCDSDDTSHNPMIRKRLWPERVNLETRSLRFRGVCREDTDTANVLRVVEGVLRESGC